MAGEENLGLDHLEVSLEKPVLLILQIQNELKMWQEF